MAALAGLLALAGCMDAEDPGRQDVLGPSFSVDGELAMLADSVRELAIAKGITHVPEPPHVSTQMARLGQMLLFDKLLSGNRNMSCMTCHPPRFGSTDAISLSIGEGGTGVGPERVHPGENFIARNAPALFSIGELDNLFWDGRVAQDEEGNFHTPAGDRLTPEMERVFQFGALSALGLFPVTDRLEMRGQPGDDPCRRRERRCNELAEIPDENLQEIWAALMDRLLRLDDYRELFREAYPRTNLRDMTFAHASNAMAGFIVKEFSLNEAPWDAFLDGDDSALSREQINGGLKFLNAPCATCHDGPLLSDDSLFNVAVAQYGPGRGQGPSGRDDFGRANITGDPADIYKFRTTPLRNVELTAPYGHAGEFTTLEGFIDHYSTSAEKLRAYSDADIPDPRLRGTLLEENKEAIIATREERIVPVVLDSVFVREVAAFFRAFTDPRARNLLHLIPNRVPSGLRVDR